MMNTENQKRLRIETSLSLLQRLTPESLIVIMPPHCAHRWTVVKTIDESQKSDLKGGLVRVDRSKAYAPKSSHQAPRGRLNRQRQTPGFLERLQ